MAESACGQHVTVSIFSLDSVASLSFAYGFFMRVFVHSSLTIFYLQTNPNIVESERRLPILLPYLCICDVNIVSSQK